MNVRLRTKVGWKRVHGQVTIESTAPSPHRKRDRENTFGFSFKPTFDLGKCCDFHNTSGPLGTAFKPT